MSSTWEASAKEWDAFTATSPQTTVFSTQAFLKSYQRPIKFFLSSQSTNESSTPAEVGVAVLETGEGACLHSFQEFNGFHYQSGEAFEATESLILYLKKKYPRVELALHWDLMDQRLLLKHGFSLVPRYTSLLEIEDSEALIKGCRSAQIKSLKSAQGAGIFSEKSDDFNLLVKFSRQTFERQGAAFSDDQGRWTREICENLAQAGLGQLFIARNSSAHKPLGAIFIGFDSRRAYYLFGASDPDCRKWNPGTKLLFDAFEYLRSRRIGEIDMVGVNSPRRGDYKLAFGGRLQPYLIARYEKAAK